MTKDTNKKQSTPFKKGNKKNTAKPWEQMNAGKAGDKKSSGKEKKPAKEFKSFLYLLPKKTTAGVLAKGMPSVSPESIEVWEEECVIEITTENGSITFEDIRDSLEKEDEKVLSELRMKQVLACDYSSEDNETVLKIMKGLLERFGGKIASDTEDFQPFLTLGDI